MNKLLIIGFGGFIGAILRYSLTRIVTEYSSLSQFWGTMVVNILGCLVLGIIIHLIEFKGFVRPEFRIFLVIGLLGSFTTFSAFAYESLTMLKTAQYFHLAFNITTQVVLGLGAVWLGMFLGRNIKL